MTGEIENERAERREASKTARTILNSVKNLYCYRDTHRSVPVHHGSADAGACNDDRLRGMG